MKKNVECICDDNGIELLVGYHYDESESQVEEGHGYHEVGCMVYTELQTVELIIAGKGIDVLPVMTQRQKDHIISKLSYE